MDELNENELLFLHSLVTNFSAPIKDHETFMALAKKLESMAQKKHAVATAPETLPVQ